MRSDWFWQRLLKQQRRGELETAIGTISRNGYRIKLRIEGNVVFEPRNVPETYTFETNDLKLPCADPI